MIGLVVEVYGLDCFVIEMILDVFDLSIGRSYCSSKWIILFKCGRNRGENWESFEIKW